jgi:polysaccharide export outer membrane protein
LHVLAALVMIAALVPFSGMAQVPAYLIGPGDILEISVRDEPEFSREVTVGPDGRISIPLIESVAASGLTPEELAKTIEEQLAIYIRDPEVAVTVTEFHGALEQRVRVVGEVVRPQSLPYQAGMTLMDAMVAIGGLNPVADGNSATLIRRTPEGEEEIDLRLDDLVRDGDESANLALVPGDVIVIPESFFGGDIQITKAVDAAVIYTDNIDLEPDDEKSSAILTRLGNTLNISADLARFTGNLSSDLGIIYNSDSSDFSFSSAVVGGSNAELIRNHLFLDLNAAVTRSVLDLQQSRSANEGITTNQDTVVTLAASPYVLHRLGDVADAEWRYQLGAVLFPEGTDSDDDQTNSVIHTVSNNLSSGDLFQATVWTLDSQAGRIVREDEKDIDFADTRFGPSYELWRGFNILGGIGYVYRTADEDGEDDELNGIAWDVGFQWDPNPSTSLGATYGQRDGDNVIGASVRQDIGPRTSIQATYTDTRETDAERFVQQDTGAEVDDDGNFIDPDTGLPLDPNNVGTSFSDETTRTKSLRGAAQHSTERNTFTLAGEIIEQTGGTDGDEDVYGVGFSWARILTRDLSFVSSVSYERNEFSDTDREDDIYIFVGSLSYRFQQAAIATVAYTYQQQDSTDNAEEFKENTVTVGVSIPF